MARYQRTKTFAAQRELSLAEVTRRGVELFLDRYPSTEPARGIILSSNQAFM